jgi:hypothetical protein
VWLTLVFKKEPGQVGHIVGWGAEGEQIEGRMVKQKCKFKIGITGGLPVI